MNSIKKTILLLFITSHLFAQTNTTTLPVKNYISVRNGLNNFYGTIHTTGKATVAFLGGSITYNPGWRDKLCAYLKETFPQTSFHFIPAGIPSLGSLPHAFRLQRDVLDSGKIDLLFVEAAVNDKANGTDSAAQSKALEGIIRHAKRSNPVIDIVLMSFADPEKTKDYNNSNRIPAEIANHELIASHYHFPSINLAKEVSDKMHNKEFSWEKDFKDLHPAPFGQQLYFDAIKVLLDTCYWLSKRGTNKVAKMVLPAPINKDCFDNGKYVSVADAKPDNDWQLVNDWQPSDSLATREGFVHVPVLMSAKRNAAFCFSFRGNAVGIAVVSGSDAGIIEYAIDDARYQTKDLFTPWSSYLHLPWYLLLSDDLSNKQHVLHIKISSEKNKGSKGNACRIVHFLVNG